jgi:transposase
MNCSFNQVNRIMHRSVDRGLKRRPENPTFAHLSIDEKSFKRNHKYVTVLSSPTSGIVIDVCEDRTKEATKDLLSSVISEDNRAKVMTISADMWKAYLVSINEILPKAKVVHDRFHLIKYLNEAIDKVRRREVKDHEELKNSRYALLKNQENLTEKQRIKFKSIQGANFEVSKAWLIREDFKEIFKSANMEEAVGLFWKWGASAINANIQEMTKIAKMFNNHIVGVCNAMVETLSNAMAERLNGKIQDINSRGRGYKNF